MKVTAAIKVGVWDGEFTGSPDWNVINNGFTGA